VRHVKKKERRTEDGIQTDTRMGFLKKKESWNDVIQKNTSKRKKAITKYGHTNNFKKRIGVGPRRSRK